MILDDAETVYSAKVVAERLKVSSGMLRRYALAYESITGKQVRQHPRDGRQYTAGQLDELLRAKAFVTANAGMSVDTAIRLALGQSEAETVNPPKMVRGGSFDEVALERAFGAALEPLLGEVRALRMSNDRMHDELRELRADRHQLATPTAELVGSKDEDERRDGLLVRAARQLERWLGRH